MRIGSRQNLAKAKFMNSKMNDRPIEHKPSTKLLEVYIDKMLTWIIRSNIFHLKSLMARECWTSWKTFRWSRGSLNYLLFTCAAPLDYWHVWEPALSACLKTSLLSHLPCLNKVDWIDFEFEWVHAVCIYWVSSMILFSFTGQNSILTPVSGESRNEFAEWHVTWFVEWHNYAEYNDSNWKVRPFLASINLQKQPLF